MRMKRAQIVYYDCDVEIALRCCRCDGAGETEIYFQSGVVETCPRCQGAGLDPRPRTYVYYVSDDVEVGDKVIVPPTFVSAEPQTATVVLMGGDYDGPIQTAVKVA